MSSERVTPYRCNVPGCGKYFTRRFNMKSHMRWHTGACPFKCTFPDCDAKFKWKSSFASHIKSHRQSALKKRSSTGSTSSLSKMQISQLLSATQSEASTGTPSTSSLVEVVPSPTPTLENVTSPSTVLSDDDSVDSLPAFETVLKAVGPNYPSRQYGRAPVAALLDDSIRARTNVPHMLQAFI